MAGVGAGGRTSTEPCISGLIAQMKWSVPGCAVTSWVFEVPVFFSPVNQESPFLLVLPIVLQPFGPASTGLIVIFSVFGLNPCHWAIERQMCFGEKQPLAAFGVFGSDPCVTSEKVWGPTFFGSVSLRTLSSSP